MAAEPLFRRILGHYRGVRAGEAIEYHIAVALLRQQRLPEARALLTRIVPAFERGLMRPRRAALGLLQADLALADGAPKVALVHVDTGLADLDGYPDADLSWKLLLRRGRVLRDLGRASEALAAFDQAASHVDDLRKGSLGYRLDTTFLGDKLELFAEAIELACAQGDGQAAARFVELVKARALAATMSIPPPRRTGRGPDEIAFDDLSTRLDALAFQSYAGAATVQSVQERRALLVRRRDVIERLRIADPRWRAMSQPPPFDLDALLGRLADGDRAALTLHRRDDVVVAVLLHEGRTRVARRVLAPSTVEALRVRTANLRLRKPDDFLFDPAEEPGVGWPDLVPPELADAALATRTLLVVPHGELHLVPWAGLEVSQGERVFERTTVGLLPNLTALTVLDIDAEPSRVALIGDPDRSGLRGVPELPEAGVEIDEIAALYPGRLLSKPLRRRAATERAFWGLADRAGADAAVLHVVCHGDVDATEPLASGLVFTDSRVEAAEVAMRRLPFRDVVLSACSTGWRPDRAEELPLTGDDALGVVAAFLEAGARFVLASVPQVLDQAGRAFATAWHRHRLTGVSPLEAVRATQLELLERSDLPVRSWVGIAGYGCR